MFFSPASFPGGGGGSYLNTDPGRLNRKARFKPKREPGFQMPTRNSRTNILGFTTAFSFFKLFFTMEMVSQLCVFTNNYARLHGAEKPSLYRGWKDVTPKDLYIYFALWMYMAVVKAPSVEYFWSTSPLFHGLWARSFMTKLRFKAIQAFLKVCNPDTENNATDKLSKVRYLIDYVREKCKKLYHPYQHVSIDERMVRNKGRFTFRQFIKDKPTRWGMKLWVMADASNGYTCDFEVYTGKGTPVSKFGLAYDVVLRLCKSIFNQGYHVFFDNFYTGVQLVLDLIKEKVYSCGTMNIRRKGLPPAFKETKPFEKNNSRGSMRWKRIGDLVFLQWLDNKVVTFLSSIHDRVTKHTTAKRRTKVRGVYRPLIVRQPLLVKDYNKHMSGVDKSDQYISRYETLRKTHRWWKTLFFHMLDVARVNSFLLFQDLRKKNPHVKQLNRKKATTSLTLLWNS